MSVYQLASTIGLESKINLSGSGFFFNLLISNFRNENNENYKWSKPLSKERLKRFETSNKEVLGKSEDTILYRVAGKLFVNKLFADGWKGKKIYG
jgi:hypothetical protein